MQSFFYFFGTCNRLLIFICRFIFQFQDSYFIVRGKLTIIQNDAWFILYYSEPVLIQRIQIGLRSKLEIPFPWSWKLNNFPISWPAMITAKDAHHLFIKKIKCFHTKIIWSFKGFELYYRVLWMLFQYVAGFNPLERLWGSFWNC